MDFEWAKIAFPFRTEGCVFKGAIILKNSHLFALLLEGTSLQKRLDAKGANIEGSIHLRNGFQAEEGVNLSSAEIGGNLECDGGTFISKGENAALYANGAKIGGSVYLRQGFEAQGKVCFDHAEFVRSFQLWDVSVREKATLDLTFAKVGTLLNHKYSWPTKGHLLLSGFVMIRSTIELSRRPMCRFAGFSYRHRINSCPSRTSN